MLRRIMIILAATTAALALAMVPAGAGTGSFEVYSAPGFTGTHSSVPGSTVASYLNSCVSVDTLTSHALSASQSTENFTSYSIGLYRNTPCSATNFITTVSPNSNWTSTSQTATYVYAT